MGFLENKINRLLQEKNLSLSKTARIINEHESSFISMVKGKREFTEQAILKFIKIIEVSKEEFTSWALYDKYSEVLIKKAYDNKKNSPFKKKSIFTIQIDNYLKDKKISRTQLSKEIKYSQSGLNQIITGKRTLPDSVLKRLSAVFEISSDEILSWKIADKYDILILEKTLSLYSIND